MSTATEVSICSNALLLLGAQTIADFDDGSDRALLASNLYPSVRDGVLRMHPWNCCVRRVALPPDVVGPPFDWNFQFTLPPDYIRTLSVGEYGAEDSFKIEGGKLLSNTDPCLLRYVARNESPASWDDLLVRAVQLAMAAAMAYPITQSSALRDSMRQEFAQVLRMARSVDGQDETPEILGDSPLLQSRFSTSGDSRNIWRG